MFERPHHKRILVVLRALDSELLLQSRCYFGGGTAIVLALGEYRESVDVDFLCAHRDGYRALRSAIAMPTLGKLVTRPMAYRRDVRADRDKISTYLDVEGAPIKVEFVLEARIDLGGGIDVALGVPVLDRTDLYAEKLLANADRGLDRSVLSRDLIDLAMMIRGWGPIPEAAWTKTAEAYGPAVKASFARCLAMLEDRDYLRSCLRTMSMDTLLADDILEALASERTRDLALSTHGMRP